ncbi:hypothetical protein LUZ61_002119 [Rhynchospora tenuis]|uniref:Reverse transcriptase zinc-binding domain-containing protein n=1 Tax=Rhynchospora tenuis TaxID=198213 RepID=A0AAD5ZIS4_9POAL|nr:hypothetical protein LUZ61_002119 [Rhynchospora tenuis]
MFSFSSAYRTLSDSGIRSTYNESLWKMKVPPRVKVFLWLLLADRLLTQVNLMLRGWPSIQECKCCQTHVLETTGHLFVLCDFAQQLWTAIQQHYNLPIISVHDNPLDFWRLNRAHADWDIIWASTSWSI